MIIRHTILRIRGASTGGCEGTGRLLRWLFTGSEMSWPPGVNPISTISRWKILDNLRRSMIEPT